MRRPDNIIYWTGDQPSHRISLMLALQQMSFLGVYLVVSPVFAHLLKLDHEQSLQLISATLLASGLGVMIQASRRWGIGSGLFCPLQATSSTFAALIIAHQVGGLDAVFGMVGVVGISQMMFAYLFRGMRAIFTVQVAGIAVMLIGLGLGYNGIKLVLDVNTGHPPTRQDALLCFLTLGGMIVCNIWSSGYLRLVSAFLGLTLGFIASWLLDLIPASEWNKFHATPLFYLPRPMNIGWEIHKQAIFPGIVTGMFLALHGFGALVAAQRFNDADWKRPDLQLVKQGVLAEGLTNLLNSFLNGLPLTSSGGAVGLAAATGCTSRYLAYWLGGLMILLAFMPKAIVFWAILPQPVMGSAMIFLAAFTTLAGLQVVASRLLDNRKIITVGVALILGVSYEPLRHLFQSVPPEVLKPMMFSGVGLGVLVAVLFSAVFRIRDGTRDRQIFTMEQSSFDEVVAYLERQGKIWGARTDVVRRAEFATWQACEILLEHGLMEGVREAARKIELETHFNEFTFSVILRYFGAVMPLSLHQPTHEEMLEDDDGVIRMAGYLLHRLADKVHTRSGTDGKSELRLVFNDQ